MNTAHLTNTVLTITGDGNIVRKYVIPVAHIQGFAIRYDSDEYQSAEEKAAEQERIRQDTIKYMGYDPAEVEAEFEAEFEKRFGKVVEEEGSADIQVEVSYAGDEVCVDFTSIEDATDFMDNLTVVIDNFYSKC